MTHALKRTSPTGVGQVFIGTCIKCGGTGLLSIDALRPCPADEAMSDSEALIKLIDPDDPPDDPPKIDSE